MMEISPGGDDVSRGHPVLSPGCHPAWGDQATHLPNTHPDRLFTSHSGQSRVLQRLPLRTARETASTQCLPHGPAQTLPCAGQAPATCHSPQEGRRDTEPRGATMAYFWPGQEFRVRAKD